MKFRHLAAAAALIMTAGAHAATVFSDDFNADAQGLSVVPSAAWTVTGGSVDVIPVGTSFHFLSDTNGNYVDLDGSTGHAGLLSTLISAADGAYTATFQLAGNHRDGNAEVVTVSFGGTTATFSPTEFQDLTTYSISGTATGGNILLSFQDASSDNIGALLDNVNVSAVPEPASLSLMLAGLAALGFAARRRRG